MTVEKSNKIPKQKETTDKTVGDIEILTQTVAQLVTAVQTQNDCILCLLHQTDIKDPGWKNKEDVEKAVGPKVTQCVKAIREVYGPRETNQS